MQKKVKLAKIQTMTIKGYSQEKTETNNFCSQPGLKIYRDQNITLEHNYVDQNNNYLFDVRVSVRNCNE